MKYRVEDGKITMPVSELNRLNDEAEKLKDKIEQIEKDKNTFVGWLEKMQEGKIYQRVSSWQGFGQTHISLIDIKTIIKREQGEIERKIDVNFSRKTLFGFLKWKKEYLKCKEYNQ